MKQAIDTQTLELPLKRGRGRPLSGLAQTASERQAARRERLRASGVDFLTVSLPADILAALSKFVEFKDLSKSDAVERILRDRLLRKR